MTGVLSAVARLDSSAVTGRVLDTGSGDAERLWLPILGPTAIALARLAAAGEVGSELARPWEWLGVREQVATGAASRLCRFGWAVGAGTTLLVYDRQYPPDPRQARKLPEPLRLSLGGVS